MTYSGWRRDRLARRDEASNAELTLSPSSGHFNNKYIQCG